MYKVVYNDVAIRHNEDMENSILFALSLHRESNERHKIFVVNSEGFVILTLIKDA